MNHPNNGTEWLELDESELDQVAGGVTNYSTFGPLSHSYQTISVLPPGTTYAQANDTLQRFNAPTAEGLQGHGNDPNYSGLAMVAENVTGHYLPAGLVDTVRGDGIVQNTTTAAHPFVGTITRELTGNDQTGYSILTNGHGEGPVGGGLLGMTGYALAPASHAGNALMGPGIFDQLDKQAYNYALDTYGPGNLERMTTQLDTLHNAQESLAAYNPFEHPETTTSPWEHAPTTAPPMEHTDPQLPTVGQDTMNMMTSVPTDIGHQANPWGDQPTAAPTQTPQEHIDNSFNDLNPSPDGAHPTGDQTYNPAPIAEQGGFSPGADHPTTEQAFDNHTAMGDQTPTGFQSFDQPIGPSTTQFEPIAQPQPSYQAPAEPSYTVPDTSTTTTSFDSGGGGYTGGYDSGGGGGEG